MFQVAARVGAQDFDDVGFVGGLADAREEVGEGEGIDGQRAGEFGEVVVFNGEVGEAFHKVVRTAVGVD